MLKKDDERARRKVRRTSLVGWIIREVPRSFDVVWMICSVLLPRHDSANSSYLRLLLSVLHQPRFVETGNPDFPPATIQLLLPSGHNCPVPGLCDRRIGNLL
jgi:hypothetical protein